MARAEERADQEEGQQQEEEAAECDRASGAFPCRGRPPEEIADRAQEGLTLIEVATATRRISWVVKASKLCNLRCRYCYEWNDLAKRDRIALDQWRSLLVAIRTYHEAITQRSKVATETDIVWHGGEPLLLPSDYIAAVMALEREILGEGLQRGQYRNFLQTNLYSVQEEKLQLLARERIELGVSMDVVGGVRLSAGGEETEDQVARNIDLLTKHGTDFGAIVVLAGHTGPHVTEIYDFYEKLGVGVRFLPLFDSPLNQAGASFAATYPQMLEALEALFVHWIDRPRHTRVSPLHEYLETILLRMLGRSRPRYDRRANGEYVLLVNTDGSLYERADAYDRMKMLGNVFEQSMDEIISSPNYRASLERDEALAARYCSSCEFLGACDTSPLFESPRRDIGEVRCHVAYPLYRFIEAYVHERRYTPADVQRILTFA